MSSVEARTHYRTEWAAPESTVKTSVLTGPATGSEWYYVTEINVCASDGNAGTVDIIQYVATANAERYYRKAAVVPAAGSLSLNPTPLALAPGDVLKFTPSRADQHVAVSFMVGRPDPNDALRRSPGTLERSQ